MLVHKVRLTADQLKEARKEGQLVAKVVEEDLKGK